MGHLMLAFPDRRIFILDWPSTGAAPRMPWTVEASDRFMRSAPNATSTKSSPLYRGVVHFGMKQRSQISNGQTYPLPEKRFVAMIEAWRKHLGIPKIIMLGHSLGGFVFFSYAETYPQHIERLILCSPCGLAIRPDAFGISEAAFSHWMDRIDEEEPQYW